MCSYGKEMYARVTKYHNGATCELKVVILVPVAERQLVQWGSISKLQVGKVPIQDLAISRVEID